MEVCDLVSGETTRVVGMITRKFLAGAAIAAGKAVKLDTTTADTVAVVGCTTASDRVIGITKNAIASGEYGYVVLEGKVQANVGSETVAKADPLTDGATTFLGKAGSRRFGTILGVKDGSNLAWVYLETGTSVRA